MHHRFIAGLLAAGALAACQKPETPEQTAARMTAETNAAHATFAALDNDFARLFSAGQTDSLVAIHTADGVEMPPNGPTVTGAAALRTMFTTNFQQAPGGTLTLTHQALTVNGPVAIDRGRWSYHGHMGAMAVADSGKYLTHWQKNGASWQIAEVMWNSDVPLPAPAPAPAHHR